MNAQTTYKNCLSLSKPKICMAGMIGVCLLSLFVYTHKAMAQVTYVPSGEKILATEIQQANFQTGDTLGLKVSINLTSHRTANNLPTGTAISDKTTILPSGPDHIDTDAVCGDGYCDPQRENSSSCPGDCPVGDTCGDVDRNDSVDIADALFITNYIFSGGPAPNPYNDGNVNSDGGVNISDVVRIIEHVYYGVGLNCPPH